MTKGINKVFILGHLGYDPKTSGNVTSFTVATGEKYTDKKTGEIKESTEWHNVTCFGKLAEISAQYLRKGSKVFICGKLKTDKYTKDGVERYATKIIADELQMLDSKNENAKPVSKNNYQAAKDGDNSQPFNDDIPF